MLLCRTDRFLSPEIKAKLALFCDVPEEAVITAKDVRPSTRCRWCSRPRGSTGSSSSSSASTAAAATWTPGRTWSSRIKNPKGEVTIGIVGKYVSFEDSYKSLNEALSHGGFGNDVKVVRRWIEAEELESATRTAKLAGVDGILVPAASAPAAPAA